MSESVTDVVVVGAGLAGLTAAITLARAGHSVELVSKGIGGIQLSQGSVDVLGYLPDRVTHPLEAAATLPAPHPYALLGSDALGAAIVSFAGLVGDLLVGDADSNVHLPTAVGAIRPTALLPPSMACGAVVGGNRYVIVGFARLKDFHPKLIADNLARQSAPDGGSISARSVIIDPIARAGEMDTTGLNFARAMDHAEFRGKVVDSLLPRLDAGELVGFPAVLGIKDPTVWEDLAQRLGREVFEIPLPPPSVPGMRLNMHLTKLARTAGVRIVMGARVIGIDTDGQRISAVLSDAAGRVRRAPAQQFLYAPGGFESGALTVDSYGHVGEVALKLPLHGVLEPLVSGDYWATHSLFSVGVGVDASMRAIDVDAGVCYQNLRVAGGIVAGANRWAEKSGDGIAIATAIRAACEISKELA